MFYNVPHVGQIFGFPFMIFTTYFREDRCLIWMIYHSSRRRVGAVYNLDAFSKFPELDMYHTDPAHHFISAG